MKQIIWVGTLVYCNFDFFSKSIVKRLLKKDLEEEKITKRVRKAYALFDVKPYYVENEEEALKRYNEQFKENRKKLKCSVYHAYNISDSSKEFDDNWDIILHHKEYEGKTIKNFTETFYTVTSIKHNEDDLSVKPIHVTYKYLNEKLEPDDFREWFWDGYKGNTQMTHRDMETLKNGIHKIAEDIANKRETGVVDLDNIDNILNEDYLSF